MLLERRVRDDGFDAVFFALARVHGEESRAEQRRLEGDYHEPGTGADPALPERPGEARRKGGDDEGEAQRQMDDSGMERQ
jgi:hypothetical protein